MLSLISRVSYQVSPESANTAQTTINTRFIILPISPHLKLQLVPHLSMRPLGSMCAIEYPAIPLPVFFLLEMMIPSSLDWSFTNRIILKFFWLRLGPMGVLPPALVLLSLLPAPGEDVDRVGIPRFSSSPWPLLRRGGFCGVTGRNSPDEEDDYDDGEHDDKYIMIQVCL